MTAFWCSSCKVSHAGDCPPAPEQVTIVDVGDCDVDANYEYDELVDAYFDLGTQDLNDLKRHYRAAKEALIRQMGMP